MIIRPTEWHKVGEFDLKGIHLWQFSPVDSFWQNETANVNNSVYYQEVDGLVNITAIAVRYIYIYCWSAMRLVYSGVLLFCGFSRCS